MSEVTKVSVQKAPIEAIQVQRVDRVSGVNSVQEVSGGSKIQPPLKVSITSLSG